MSKVYTIVGILGIALSVSALIAPATQAFNGFECSYVGAISWERVMRSKHPNKGTFGRPEYQAAKMELVEKGWLYCTQCMQIKRLFCFSRHYKSHTGYMSHCKNCDAEKRSIRCKQTNVKKWREAYWHSHAHRRAQLKSLLKCTYRMTLDDYHQLVAVHENKCAICGGSPTTHRLHIDHNHETGKVRGLLCSGCNLALGRFHENPLLVRKAAEYLEKGGFFV